MITSTHTAAVLALGVVVLAAGRRGIAAMGAAAGAVPCPEALSVLLR